MAEVFGAELLELHEYSFPAGSKVCAAAVPLCGDMVLTPAPPGTREQIPIYSWYGAKVKIADSAAVGNTAYLSSDTPMSTYANIHQRLEARRAEAAKAGSHGPRVRTGARARPWWMVALPCARQLDM